MGEFYHEYKYSISGDDMELVRQRLIYICSKAYDPSARQEIYTVRTVAVEQKPGGQNKEQTIRHGSNDKFYLRYYNGDVNRIKLIKTSRWGELMQKSSMRLTPEEAERLIKSDTEFLSHSENSIARELCRNSAQGIKTGAVTEFIREAYSYPDGNVGITFDTHARTGLMAADFLSDKSCMIPMSIMAVMKVRYDAYLPEMIADALCISAVKSAKRLKYEVNTACGSTFLGQK